MVERLEHANRQLFTACNVHIDIKFYCAAGKRDVANIWVAPLAVAVSPTKYICLLKNVAGAPGTLDVPRKICAITIAYGLNFGQSPNAAVISFKLNGQNWDGAGVGGDGGGGGD